MQRTEVKQAPLRAGLRDLLKDQTERLLVLKCGVAGLPYHLDPEEKENHAIFKSLTPGTELKLYRDSENTYDRWAVRVYTADERLVGFITRFKNETIV